MKTIDEIRELARLLGAAGAETFKRRQGGNALRLRFAPRTSGPATRNPAMRVLLSPATGVLRLHHPLSMQGTLDAGSMAMPGQALAWIECGVALVPLEAPAKGRMACLLLREGETAQAGCPLAMFSPMGSA